MRHWLRDHGLVLVLSGLFLLCMVGQTLTGLREHNQEQREHGQTPVSLAQYLKSGHFLEATAENWESEFLQMAMYVVLTVFLFQKGSSESKAGQEEEYLDADPAQWKDDPQAPSPVRRGGWLLWLYSHSLSIAFFALFIGSFALHLFGGLPEFNEQRTTHGEAPATWIAYLFSAQFWFESFQNWQSEFLSLAAMVYLTVYLRERGSPESKPVATPHHMSADEWEHEQEEKEKQKQSRQRDGHPGSDPAREKMHGSDERREQRLPLT